MTRNFLTIIIIIIVNLFKSQLGYLAAHECSTNWEPTNQLKSEQLNQMKCSNQTSDQPLIRAAHNYESNTRNTKNKDNNISC